MSIEVIIAIVCTCFGLGVGLLIGFAFAKEETKKRVYLAGLYDDLVAVSEGRDRHLSEAHFENNRLQAELERAQSGDTAPVWHQGPDMRDGMKWVDKPGPF